MKYKETGIEWLGIVPKHWKVNKLSLNVPFKTGFTPSTSRAEFYGGEHNWVTIDDLNGGVVINTKTKLTELGINGKKSKLVKKDSLFYSFKLTVGKVGFAGEDMYTNEAIASFEPNESIDINYLYYSFSDYLLNNAKENIYGAKLLNSELIKNSKILVPPRLEQIAIANYLDKACQRIDKIIKIKEEQIKKLESYFNNKISDYTTKGLVDSDIVSTDCLWIPKIKKGWKIHPLKRLLSAKLKYGANEPAINEDLTEPRYIRITDFSNDGKLRSNTFKSLPFYKAKDYLLKDGDVLFARSGATVGKTFIFKDYDGLACFAGYLIKAECNKELLLPEYLYFFTKSRGYEEWKNLIFTQATIQNIGADKYQYLKISTPSSIEEQREIVNKIISLQTKIDETKSKIKSQIKTLKNYRKSLIHEYVTGKKLVVKHTNKA